MSRLPIAALLLAAGQLPALMAEAGSEAVEAAAPIFYQEASWAPGGSDLLLSRFDDDRYRIYQLDLRSGHMQRLTEGPDYWTSWAPDGTRFAFKSNRDGNGEIYVARADGSDPHPISRDPADETTPAWSPDGRTIAFVSNRSGRYQLYLMDPDGRQQRRVAETPGETYNPAWSPTGDRLAYFTTNDGDWIEIIGTDGHNRVRIGLGVFPSWSPDGTQILLSRDRRIFSITLAGRNEALLIEDGFAGRWSPTGDRIAFIRGQWPRSEVFVAAADGSAVRLVTTVEPSGGER
jgi:Tol biopolymer transport system component